MIAEGVQTRTLKTGAKHSILIYALKIGRKFGEKKSRWREKLFAILSQSFRDSMVYVLKLRVGHAGGLVVQ